MTHGQRGEEGRRGEERGGERRGEEGRGGERRGEEGRGGERRGEEGRGGQGRGGEAPLLLTTIHAPCTFMNIHHDDANYSVTQ